MPFSHLSVLDRSSVPQVTIHIYFMAYTVLICMISSAKKHDYVLVMNECTPTQRHLFSLSPTHTLHCCIWVVLDHVAEWELCNHQDMYSCRQLMGVGGRFQENYCNFIAKLGGRSIHTRIKCAERQMIPHSMYTTRYRHAIYYLHPRAKISMHHNVSSLSSS